MGKFTFVSFRGIPYIHRPQNFKDQIIINAPCDQDISLNLRSIFSCFLRPPELGSGALRLKLTQSRQPSSHILFSLIQQHFHKFFPKTKNIQAREALCRTSITFLYSPTSLSGKVVLSNEHVCECELSLFVSIFVPTKCIQKEKLLL